MRIEVFRHGQLLQEVSLQDAEIWVGRDESCKIRLDDRAVSRKHAVLRNAPGGGFEFQKISEFGMMKLNGRTVDHSKLNAGDRLEVGPFEIRLIQKAEAVMQVAQNIETAEPVTAIPIEVAPNPTTEGEIELNDSMAEVAIADPMAEAAQDSLASEDQSVDSDFNLNAGESGFGGMDGLENGLPEGDHPSGGMDDPSIHQDFGGDDHEKTRFISKGDQVRAVLDFGDGREFEVTDEEIAIGRSQQCHVVLEDRRSSRKNTLIYKRDGKYQIKDLSSANGTFVNGDRIEESELHSGDEVRVGDTVFKFKQVQSDYEIRQQEFISVPPPEVPLAPAELSPYQNPQPTYQNPFAQTQVPPQQPQAVYEEPEQKKRTLLGGVIERYRMMNTRMQIIWGIVVLFGIWTMMEPDPGEQKVKMNVAGQKKKAQVANAEKKKDGGLGSIETLTPEQRQYIETQYQFAFDLYKNREYDRCLLELEKIFSLVTDFKNAREIAAFAREGKRKLEAIEEERKRKEQERQVQLKLQGLIEQAGHLMSAKKYPEAEALFPEIELIQPENFAVGEWRKQIVAETEKTARELEEKRKLEETRKKAWTDFEAIASLKKEKKHYEALDLLDEILARKVDDQKLNEALKAEVMFHENAIDAEREPVLLNARQLEKEGKLIEAYRDYEKALRIDPMNEEAPEAMKRIKGVVTDRAKHVYTEGVFAESFGDVDTAEKKYREVLEVVPKGDAYYIKAESKLRKITVLRKSASEAPPQ